MRLTIQQASVVAAQLSLVNDARNKSNHLRVSLDTSSCRCAVMIEVQMHGEQDAMELYVDKFGAVTILHNGVPVTHREYLLRILT